MRKRLSLLLVHLGFAVVALPALEGCKLIKSNNAKTKDAGRSDQGWDEADFPVVSSKAEGMKRVVKSILGIPLDGDNGRMTGPGLIHIAKKLGYAWPDNDCNAKWVFGPSGSGADAAIKAYAPHTGAQTVDGQDTGACNNQYFNQPVAYTFTGWQTEARAKKLEQNLSDDELAAAAAAFQPTSGPNTATGSGGALQHGAVSASIDENNNLVFDAPDSIVATCCTGSGAAGTQTVSLSYSRAISKAHMTSVTDTTSQENATNWSVAVGGELTAEVKAAVVTTTVKSSLTATTGGSTATTQSHAATTSDTTTTTNTSGCSYQVVVPTSCHFTVTLKVGYREVRSKFSSLIKMRPKSVEFNGAVAGASNNKPATSIPCNLGNSLTYGSNCTGQNVDVVYPNDGNQADNFAAAMNNAVAGGDVFKWDKLHGGADVDGIDDDLTFLQAQNFAQFELPSGSDTNESIASCSLDISADPTDPASCQSAQQSNANVPITN